MKFILILFSISLFATVVGHAQTTITGASGIPAINSKSNEIEINPLLSYGSVSGFEFGADLGYYRLLAHSFQIGLGAKFLGGNYAQTLGGTLGIDYNFSDDLSSSFMLGLLVGYQNENNYQYGGQENRTSYGIKFGKRFAFSNNANIAYKPYVSVNEVQHIASDFNDGYQSVDIEFQVLNFSYQF